MPWSWCYKYCVLPNVGAGDWTCAKLCRYSPFQAILSPSSLAYIYNWKPGASTETWMAPSCYGGMPIQFKPIFEFFFPTNSQFYFAFSLKQRCLNDYNLCPRRWFIRWIVHESHCPRLSLQNHFINIKKLSASRFPPSHLLVALSYLCVLFCSPGWKLKMFHGFVCFCHKKSWLLQVQKQNKHHSLWNAQFPIIQTSISLRTTFNNSFT